MELWESDEQNFIVDCTLCDSDSVGGRDVDEVGMTINSLFARLLGRMKNSLLALAHLDFICCILHEWSVAWERQELRENRTRGLFCFVTFHGGWVDFQHHKRCTAG